MTSDVHLTVCGYHVATMAHYMWIGSSDKAAIFATLAAHHARAASYLRECDCCGERMPCVRSGWYAPVGDTAACCKCQRDVDCDECQIEQEGV